MRRPLASLILTPVLLMAVAVKVTDFEASGLVLEGTNDLAPENDELKRGAYLLEGMSSDGML